MVSECVFCKNPIGETATFCPKCGELSLLKEKYRITRKLGQGGFGVVYEANDLHLTRRYAVKVIKSESSMAQQAVKSEANIHAQHARSFPFMPEIYDIIEMGTRTALVMEYIEGKTLEELLEEQGVWSVSEVEEFLTTMLGYLEKLHEVGLVHRDIKPANIKSRGDRRYVLLDFGIAKQQQHGGTLTGAKALSMFYSPPEQMKGQPTDARSDLYSLGATAYHLLSGLPLPSADVRERSDTPFPLPRQLAHDPNAPLAICLRRMLELQPESRPLNARVALSILQGDVTPPIESSAGKATVAIASPVIASEDSASLSDDEKKRRIEDFPSRAYEIPNRSPEKETPQKDNPKTPEIFPTPGAPPKPVITAATVHPAVPDSSPVGSSAVVLSPGPSIAPPAMPAGMAMPKPEALPKPVAPPSPSAPSIHDQQTVGVPSLQQRKQSPQNPPPSWDASVPSSSNPPGAPEQREFPRREAKQYIPPIHTQRVRDLPSREAAPERDFPRHEPVREPAYEPPRREPSRSYEPPRHPEPPRREPSLPYEPPRREPVSEQRYGHPDQQSDPYDAEDTVPFSASLVQWWRTWGFWFWWVLATMMGAGVGLGVAVPIGGMAATYLHAIPFPLDPFVIPALSGAIVGIVFGAITGFPQWFVLRRRLRRSGWWLLASAMGLIVGAGLLLSGSPQPLAIGAAIGTIAGVATGTTAGRYLEHMVNSISGGILMVLVGAGVGGGMAATGTLQNLAIEMGALYGALVGFAFFWLLRGILAMISDDDTYPSMGRERALP